VRRVAGERRYRIFRGGFIFYPGRVGVFTSIGGGYRVKNPFHEPTAPFALQLFRFCIYRFRDFYSEITL
jgi:hypothetical protein